MSCLQVTAPGFFTTVQDLGRPGYAHLGVSACGAADPLSLRLGNMLLGNPQNTPALEMTMTGGTFRFPEGGTFALTGFASNLNGTPIAPWTTTCAPPHAELCVGRPQSGTRGYLCIRGGIRVPLVFGSASTHFLSGIGGIAGRALLAGDLLRIGREPVASPKAMLRKRLVISDNVLRTTLGPQASRFSEQTQQSFYNADYFVSKQANRMGLRMEGPELRTLTNTGTLSQGVSNGSVQVTNSGQPLILFVEQQTTGGYPLIANIISADLHKIGQLAPGNRVRFELVTIAEAVALYRQQEHWIAAGDMFA
jgi:biotin-dependent carboxylase-like uncharacterized protein